MKTPATLQRTLQALFITGISTFALAPALATDIVEVTADAAGTPRLILQITVDHFGGDPKQPNFLPIVPGLNYIVRLYRPKKEILDRRWTFPNAQAVD